ncbi:KH domain-containing protein [Iocasia frigidifontis]|uniref:RNA-binding protein KhpA n=1 Tax=Iocasia fonsfrigidae TaxID=2682810 RepID=A0A8A7KG21_9FIRM|nr:MULTISPECIES: KH domain-containing protein [Halanaerobiaceae]AZO95592.1 KH domain-containing protein [Halocella sp. SP3-1]MTI60767.1 KH domain-containing protein [Bacillota bacterium]QTL98459.1 KH domain-containing protein [Iocasia fonsfrigidae]
MKELVETIARSIVDYPDMVHINEVEGEKSVILEISVADDDMGKIIGRQGRIARAIRTVVKAAATKEGKKVIVDIQEK